jgi:thioredoxin reductase (NADPH)
VELARKAGIMLDASGKHIQIGQDGSTNVPGIFAAGDCTGGLLQVAKAVHEGAEAGLAAVRYLKKKASGADKT